jgi:hypothetical protein
LVLIEGCAIQIAGLAVLVLTTSSRPTHGTSAGIDGARVWPGLGVGAVVGRRALDGQACERRLRLRQFMAGTAQIANAPAAVGALFFAIESASNTQHALFAALTMFALSIIACVAFLSSLPRRAM